MPRELRRKALCTAEVLSSNSGLKSPAVSATMKFSLVIGYSAARRAHNAAEVGISPEKLKYLEHLAFCVEVFIDWNCNGHALCELEERCKLEMSDHRGNRVSFGKESATGLFFLTLIPSGPK